MIKTILYHRFIGISLTKKLLSVKLVLLLMLFPYNVAFATYGGNAVFYCDPLNGKTGENEIRLFVDTDGAEINHLIFDLIDDSSFDLTGSNDPLEFPLHNNNVLGTETPFTTVSGDYGYDLASANPVNLSDGIVDIHFATLIADKNQSNGSGGNLQYDVDTAIYVNTVREGSFNCNYTILPNEPPIISLPAVNGVDLSLSTVAPTAASPLPTSLVQNVSVNAILSYFVTDNTDASVRRRMWVYKRLDDGSWNYSNTASGSANIARNGTDMTFSDNVTLEFSSYYKVVFEAIDDQGANDIETYYFSTQADNIAPTQVPRSFMTFISDSDNRADVISQISFVRTTDNDAVDSYYLWSHEYLVAKNIINSDGSFHSDLDTDFNSLVSTEERSNAFRQLVNDGNYIISIDEATAVYSPYLSITGNDVDKEDNGQYLVVESIMEDVLYMVASDVSSDIAGNSTSNFSNLAVVNKLGDVFGAEVTLNVQGADYKFITGQGSLDVWDSVYLYRNIIGLNGQYPTLVPDMIYSVPFVYPTNTSISSSNPA